EQIDSCQRSGIRSCRRAPRPARAPLAGPGRSAQSWLKGLPVPKPQAMGRILTTAVGAGVTRGRGPGLRPAPVAGGIDRARGAPPTAARATAQKTTADRAND